MRHSSEKYFRAEVCWHEYGFFIRLGDITRPLLTMDLPAYEIIGNIYEGLHIGEKPDIIEKWNNIIKTQSQNPSKGTKSVEKLEEK